MPYRFEIAAQGRAGCQDTQCKKDGIKIQKGELRQGTFVQIPNSDFPASWKWRHWGCITPRVWQNIKADFEEDPDLIENLSELPEDQQQRIIDAIAAGHVPDEDWRGDTKKNRPPGFKWDDDDENDEDGGEKKKKTTKKRGRKAADDDDEDKAPPTKRGRKSKKAKAEEDDEEEEVDTAPAKPKGKRKSARDTAKAVNYDDEDDEAAEKKPKKGRGKPKATNGDAEDAPPPAAATKRVRPTKKKVAEPSPADEGLGNDEEDAEEEAPKAKGKGRPRKKA
ncbi:Poly(ADP-ribose) polymerase and DNA-Ligase Zn-finger region-containing protein [Elsinoe fawcettii]|nr:Poly(ADP-ribose) polymerase and DNA-Ligase Zn-finger region-containing protein [Elsinoe fawcettii]